MPFDDKQIMLHPHILQGPVWSFLGGNNLKLYSTPCMARLKRSLWVRPESPCRATHNACHSSSRMTWCPPSAGLLGTAHMWCVHLHTHIHAHKIKTNLKKTNRNTMDESTRGIPGIHQSFLCNKLKTNKQTKNHFCFKQIVPAQPQIWICHYSVPPQAFKITPSISHLSAIV